jgi:hypothetical protein
VQQSKKHVCRPVHTPKPMRRCTIMSALSKCNGLQTGWSMLRNLRHTRVHGDGAETWCIVFGDRVTHQLEPGAGSQGQQTSQSRCCKNETQTKAGNVEKGTRQYGATVTLKKRSGTYDTNRGKACTTVICGRSG